MAFGDLFFLVNSAAVHAGLRQRRGKTWLKFGVSMGPESGQIRAIESWQAANLIWVGTHRAAA